ncbi:MAG TPA: PQQ-dependent dehydrogenase, methanol/ethanol family [Candidatus Acidoferrum sp.]|nr:PQQ-dependent dehydrogenase, methanol/ethanol family [Candidatus Acidoferrum sp.]
MIMRFSVALLFAISALSLGGCKSSNRSGGTDDAADWTMYGRTNDEQRFSPLNQISEQNVGQLGLVWSRELGTTRGLEATPLVANGVIYTTGEWSVAYALDAKTGEILWTFDPKVPRARARTICCDVVNRGVALYRGKVYLGTLDGRLIALDAKSGNPVWDVVTVDQSKPYAITGAPRIAKGMVLIGNAGSEFGVRGYVSAYDAETGKLIWRTFTVPGDPSRGFESKALERAAKTWHGEWWVAGGGGTPWDTIVYDPEFDLVYTGTGNGTAWYRALRSPGGGDNLYLASILALRASDGELVWHFQPTPGDNWDYDATQPLMLANLEIGGRTRKVIMQASKNGFFYVLDRETGQLISAKAFVSNITWASGIDPRTGRPIESATAYAGLAPVLVSPDAGGAHNWYPMAFHPATGLVYLPAREGTTLLHVPDPEWKFDPTRNNKGTSARYEGPLLAKWASSPPPTGRLIAWNPVELREVWRVTHPVVESGGVLATAGNLVFQGRADGIFLAYRATDGAKLWEFDAGTGIMAPPVTFLLDGVQHITIMIGWGGAPGLTNPRRMGPTKAGFGRILTFAIGGTAQLDVPFFGHKEPPTPAIRMHASPATVREGKFLYATFWYQCHGIDAVAGAAIPDLRYASAQTHGQFEAIVLGGARESRGMPSFGDALKRDQIRAIQAYVLSRAAASANPPSNKAPASPDPAHNLQ